MLIYIIFNRLEYNDPEYIEHQRNKSDNIHDCLTLIIFSYIGYNYHSLTDNILWILFYVIFKLLNNKLKNKFYLRVVEDVLVIRSISLTC